MSRVSWVEFFVEEASMAGAGDIGAEAPRRLRISTARLQWRQ